MERIIKFRTWHKGGDGMREVQPNMFGKVYGNDCYELMQFTGILDANGKEIYEGDIVGYMNPRQEDKMYSRKIIQWITSVNSTGFNIRMPRSRGAGSVEMRYVVLGNIYQNPELLTND